MVKFALNFCYCVVDQEKDVFPPHVRGPPKRPGTSQRGAPPVWGVSGSRRPKRQNGAGISARPRNDHFCKASRTFPSLPLLLSFPALQSFVLCFRNCKQLLHEGYSRDALAKPSVEGPCRALHAEGYPLPKRIPKMIGDEG